MITLRWTIVTLALAAQVPGGNMLVNGDASAGTSGWRIKYSAATERLGDVTCFTIRSTVGSLQQEVRLPPNTVGMYAAVLARGQVDRIDTNGNIMGMPVLYGSVMTADRLYYLAYWQGQQMRARPARANSWVTLSGVFSVPYGAGWVTIELMREPGKGGPGNGSVARFSDVRLVLFPTEEAARDYVDGYK